MIVDELFGLTEWVAQQVKPNISAFENLANALDHNAGQPQKQPLRGPLVELEAVLKNMTVESLTQEQVNLLSQLDVYRYFGIAGWETVQKLIKEGEFDPATASDEMRKIVTAVSSLADNFQLLQQCLTTTGYSAPPARTVDGGVVTRVHFQDKAAISDVVDLKKWSSDWHDIARGLASSVDERPEDVQVLGASTGSVIIVLSSTVAVASLLAIIAKRSSTIVMSVLDIMNGIEDLRHKKVLNKAIEKAMKEQAVAIRATGIEDAMNDIKQFIGSARKTGSENELKLAVEKFFNFTEKGGEVDMIAPARNEEADEVDDLALRINGLNDTIEEVRKIKAETQRLLGKAPEGPGQ
jgi:hypothetical protein